MYVWQRYSVTALLDTPSLLDTLDLLASNLNEILRNFAHMSLPDVPTSSLGSKILASVVPSLDSIMLNLG